MVTRISPRTWGVGRRRRVPHPRLREALDRASRNEDIPTGGLPVARRRVIGRQRQQATAEARIDGEGDEREVRRVDEPGGHSPGSVAQGCAGSDDNLPQSTRIRGVDGQEVVRVVNRLGSGDVRIREASRPC